MIKLTQTQLSVLSQAAVRDDGAACVPGKLKRSSAAKLSASLVARKLMREVRAKLDMPVWREDDGHKIALVILKAGRGAIGAVANAAGEPANAAPASEAEAQDGADAQRSKPLQTAFKEQRKAVAEDAPREGSKQALVVELLSSRGGASVEALSQATGWLAHTTRAALTGLRKRVYAIERLRGADGETRYALSSAPANAQA